MITNHVINNKELMKKWDWDKNNAIGLFPDKLTCGSNKKVWWICSKDKRHVFDAKICHVAEGRIICPVCSNQKIIAGVNDLETTNPELLKEWDYSKNDISPQQVSHGMTKKVWWKCNKGHEWQATINSRAGYQKTGCPYCKNELKISLPEKTLAYYLSKYHTIEESKHFKWLNKMEIDIYIPDLNLGIEYDGKQWHKNIARDLDKDNLCLQNNINLIRIRENGCPTYISKAHFITIEINKDVIAQLKEMIAQTFNYINNNYNTNLNPYPDIDNDYINILNKTLSLSKQKCIADSDLMKEWNFEKNKDINPALLSLGMHKKVWWKCNKGHEWQAMIYSRASGIGCPYCTGQKVLAGENDLQTLYPNIAKEWNYEKNGDIKPTQIRPKSNKIYWWKCSKCEHEWKTAVSHRTEGKNCPKCARQITIASHYKKVINIDTNKIYDNVKTASKELNINPSALSNCCRGISKTAGGFHWKYLDK